MVNSARFRTRKIWMALAAMIIVSPAELAAADSKTKVKDPNERICETQKVLGSRLAVRRVCATRAEWAEKRAQERGLIDRTQTRQCVIDPATGLCS